MHAECVGIIELRRTLSLLSELFCVYDLVVWSGDCFVGVRCWVGAGLDLHPDREGWEL